VIAVHGGGAVETVQEGVTGVFFSGGPDELATAVLDFDDRAVDPADCVANADRFNLAVFQQALPREVELAMTASPGALGAERQVPRARRGRRALTRRPA
jgi:hypothetical protein